MVINIATAAGDAPEFIDLDKIDVDKEALGKLPAEVARYYLAFPFRVDGRVLSVAMSEPKNLIHVDDLKILSGFNIRAYRAESSAIERAITRYYGSD